MSSDTELTDTGSTDTGGETVQRWDGVVLGPLALPEGRFEMRTPRLSDGPAWSQARLANRQWLERAFPAWGDDWAAEQSTTAWTERWWQLRRAALTGRAMPFVLLLDGRLIGEIGVDAVDALSHGGEASVWMVRDHGSAAVMNAASLLLIHSCFTAPRPLDRMVSPVATVARNGRSPGLRAVGMRIEGTAARKVGDKGMVDHDIWVTHNTATTRARLESLIARLPRADVGRSARGRTGPMVVPALRAAVRGLRRGASRLSAAPASADRPTVGGVTLLPVALRLNDPAGWVREHAARRRAPHGMAVERIELDGVPVGSVWTQADPGTAIHEIVASIGAGVDRAVLRSALQLALLDVAPDVRASVRVPSDPVGRQVPDEEMLRDLGFTLVATFEGNPEGPHGWAGEQRWDLVT